MSTEDKEYVPSLDELVFFEGDTTPHPFGEDEATSDTEAVVETPDEDVSDVEDSTNLDASDEDVEDVEDSEDISSEDLEDDSEDADDADDDVEGPDDGSSLSAYYNFLESQGLLHLPEDFEFDGTPEGFQKAVQLSKDNSELAGAQMLWDRLPKDFQLVLEYGLNGGTDISKVRTVVDGQLNLDDADLERVQTQKDLVRAHLSKTTKYSDKKIDKVINRLITLGELEEEAESALTELKDYQEVERKRLAEEAAEETKQRQELLRKSYDDFTSVVTNLEGVSKKQKDNIVKSIWTTGKYGDQEGISYFNYVDSQVKSNPEHLAQLAEMYLRYDPKKGFKSDTVTRKAKTELNKQFRSSLDELTRSAGKSKVRAGNRTGNRKGNKDQGLGALEAFLKQQRN